MPKGIDLLNALPERDILREEYINQKGIDFFNEVMMMPDVNSIGSLIRGIDFTKTKHGFDFWRDILHREIKPKLKPCKYSTL